MNFSVIIPTLNAEQYLASCLDSIFRTKKAIEVVVVDGGSGDATQKTAEAYPVCFVPAAKGRGSQMNVG
ncbi:MAG: glycosyltransferase, partial [Candidatus Omnitrophica bacterium]|nr:glycosyltransferase [Candidatus Omnitrophota bacterium]